MDEQTPNTPEPTPPVVNSTGHEAYVITIKFLACEGMDDRVKDEIRALKEFIETKSLDHAWNKKVYINHEPATQRDLLH